MNETSKKCFVLMPFAEQYLEIYQEVYKPVCAKNSIECWRVDEISRPGSITRDIVEGILDADIVIADLTSRNPNVFYELGIAHSIGNKTIMTSQSLQDVPFDIANYRVLIYDQSIKGSKKLADDLERAIRDLLAALDRTNNPLQDALSQRTPIGTRKKTPLAKYIDLADMPSPLRRWLQSQNIIYAEDVASIDLRKVPEVQGLGKVSLGKFFAALLEHDLHPDSRTLQDVIVQYGIRTKPSRYGSWG